jgi:hypothetical protein
MVISKLYYVTNPGEFREFLYGKRLSEILEKTGTGAPSLHWFSGDGTEPTAVPIKAIRCNARMALIFLKTDQDQVHSWTSNHVITKKRRGTRLSPLKPILSLIGRRSHDPAGTSFWRR